MRNEIPQYRPTMFSKLGAEIVVVPVVVHSVQKAPSVGLVPYV